MTASITRAITIFVAVVCIIGTTPNAQAEELLAQSLCMNQKGSLSITGRCSKQARPLDIQDLGDLLQRPSECGACSVNIAGKWKYKEIIGTWGSGERNIVFNQYGKQFKAVDSANTMVGSIEGNVMTFVIVVTGEELMGHVWKVTAAVDGDRIYGVMEDINGQYGSFTARR